MKSLIQRWSFWHTSMLLISLGYFIETAIWLSNLYWWKYTAIPKVMVEFVTEEEFVEARGLAMKQQITGLAMLLVKYGWYASLVGFGCLEGVWKMFSGLKFFKKRFPHGHVFDAFAGALFFGAFLVIHYFFLRLARFLIRTRLACLLTLRGPLTILLYLLDEVVDSILPSLTVFSLTWLETRYGAKVIAIYPFLNVGSYFVEGVLVFGLKERFHGIPITEMHEIPAQKAIIALCEKVGFNPQRIYWSTNNSRLAFLIGFGPLASIVLSDQLCKEGVERLVSVVAHELGHWYYSHSIIRHTSVFIRATIVAALFYLFRRRLWSQSIVKGVSVTKLQEVPLALAIVIFAVCIMPLGNFISQSAHNIVSFACEVVADQFVVKLGYGEAFIRRLADNARDYNRRGMDSPFYSFFYHPHPPHNVRFNLIRGKGIFEN